MKKTPLYNAHLALKANMVEFAGWLMPLHYPAGIIEEHLAARKNAGLFDVSHMGRFIFRGKGALPFLQHALTNNAQALNTYQSQYTIISNPDGYAIDDAYLYRFFEDEYILVVNAGNTQKDWDYFKDLIKEFKGIEILDKTEELSMLSLQGPLSKAMLNNVIDTSARSVSTLSANRRVASGSLPEPFKNQLSIVKINGIGVLISRTGYTGEPLGFELFINSNDALTIWDILVKQGAFPAGLGARDTLRLEAGLPLYGHELGLDLEGKEIPVFSSPLSRFAVSFSPVKGDFIGKNALLKQFEALKRIVDRDYSLMKDLSRLIMPLLVIEKGVVRQGYKVFSGERQIGYVTSGTMVPYYKFEGEGLSSKIRDLPRGESVWGGKNMRAICLALLDSNIDKGDSIDIEVRGKRIKAVIVSSHLGKDATPYARPIVIGDIGDCPRIYRASRHESYPKKVQAILTKALENTIWRQRECINLIPSEQTQSPMARLVSIMDPAFRYGEHKPVKAFNDMDVFYYQGTDFIKEVERLLEHEMAVFLGCSEVETRLISGQMANAAVFSGLVNYLNRLDRHSEPRRIRYVLNNHIAKGGHLSSQPMGALHDYVSHSPETEKPAVLSFPVLSQNPYKIDVAASKEIISRYKPELIIFGKSMVLHPEPVKEIRSFVDELSIKCFIMYDMAHVLGLVGPYFQEPFKQGVDILTGSTHKTFFGTQRGIIASNYNKKDPLYEFWKAIKKRTFPGSVSNHHLGTLLGLLIAAYEMNYFKDGYQKNVLENAKAFANALKHTGMEVAGDPECSYTETHQVIVNVGYAKGPEMAKRLEDNNIIVNFQAAPFDEGFTAASALRLGVQEMTRFGMGKEDFKTIAQLMHDIIIEGKSAKEEVKSFRLKFIEPEFCFTDKEFAPLIKKLHELI